MQSIDANVVVGVCGVVDGENVRQGLGSIRWQFV